MVEKGLMREVEVGLTMDLATAQALHLWLGQKLDIVAKANKEKTVQEVAGEEGQ